MNRILFFSLFLAALPFAAHAQIESITDSSKPVRIKKWYQPFRTNAFDKAGNYHGRWKIYINNDQDLIRNGRFRHGKEAGTWRYYYPEGGLYMVEKYKRGSDNIQVKKYHQNGKLAKVGTAKMISNAEMAHYYWEGEWQVYDEQGNYSHTETYLKGALLGRKD